MRHRALRPGGRFFSDYKLGGGEGHDEFGRLYNFPTRETLLEMFADSSWVLEQIVNHRAAGWT